MESLQESKSKAVGLNEVTAGMTPQEKEIYFAHMEKRHKEEAEKIQLERERTRAYKESLIQDILAKGYNHNRYTEEQLRSKSIRVLEMMW